MQSNPLIIEPNRVPGIYKNAKRYRARTAVGIDPAGNLILLCTFRNGEAGEPLSGIDLFELMQIMLVPPDKGGLGVAVALNLDGGTSSAMSVNHPKLSFEIESPHPVANALAIYRRK